jgi:carboxyl-terminal processing protease
LDYTNKNEDGTVNKITDSLKKEFNTKVGRKVYDGGGLDPDIAIKEYYLGSITHALLVNGYIFDYASLFSNTNPPPNDLINFTLSDQQYNQFTAWLESQNFQYSTAMEENSKQLLASAKEEHFFPEMENHLAQLKKYIETSKAEDLLRFKSEIKYLLEQQIAFHYNLVEGQTMIALHKDDAIIQAIATLNNSSIYKKILSAN